MTYISKKDDAKERSYKFALQIISLVDGMKQDLASQTIARQVLRSASSIGANIVEAQASPTRRDFALFLHHALKSANETGYWLKLIRDSNRVSAVQANALISECDQLAKILGASLVTVKNRGVE